MQCRRIVSEKQRRRRPKMGLPCGAGRFSAATSSLVLDVARLRHRPRSSSRSKIASARWSPYSLPGPKEIVAIHCAYREVLKRAAVSDLDLMVMGAQGSGGVELMLYGASTQHGVRAATCPVLTVRA